MILGKKRPITLVIMDHPAHKLVRENASYVKFDATTGELMEVYNEAEAGVGARLHYAMEPLHFGRLGGSMTLRVIYAIAGVLNGLLSVSGYVIYVIRKLKSRSNRSRRSGMTGRRTRASAPGAAGASHAPPTPQYEAPSRK